MADVIRKIYETTEVKQIGEHTLEFVASTEDVDRDGEVIKQDGWLLDNYRKDPVFMWAHDYKQPPIGKTQIDIRNRQMICQTDFTDKETYEFGDTICKLYKGGFLHTVSVAFVPVEWEDGDGEKAPRRTFLKQELLEVSAVPVPSNPNALITRRQARKAQIDMEVLVKGWGEAIEKVEEEAVEKPEETDDFIRIPVRECKITATIDISADEGIKALYCGKEKQVATYLFDKREPYNWTMERAEKWVEDHKGEKQETYQCECLECGYTMDSEEHCKDIKCPKCGSQMRRSERPGPGQEGVADVATDGNTVIAMVAESDGNRRQRKELSQAEIKDELDYLADILSEHTLADDSKEIAWDVVREIMRISGNDMPVDIYRKAGAVLNARNKGALKDAQGLIQSVLDSAEQTQEESVSPEMDAAAVVRMTADVAREYLEKLLET